MRECSVEGIIKEAALIVKRKNKEINFIRRATKKPPERGNVFSGKKYPS